MEFLKFISILPLCLWGAQGIHFHKLAGNLQITLTSGASHLQLLWTLEGGSFHYFRTLFFKGRRKTATETYGQFGHFASLLLPCCVGIIVPLFYHPIITNQLSVRKYPAASLHTCYCNSDIYRDKFTENFISWGTLRKGRGLICRHKMAF